MSAVRSDPRRVAVTGIGVIAPLADSAGALHEALLAGRSGVRPVEAFDTADLPCHRAADLDGFSPERYLEGGNLRPLDRTGRLAAAAARLALEDAGWTPDLREEAELGLVLGTMFGSVRTISEFDRRALIAGPQYVKPFDFANSVINAAAGQAAIWHGLRGVNATVAGGTTAGLQALSYAVDLVRSGRVDAVLAGGADELCFESFLGFARGGMLADDDAGDAGAVPFHADRRGFQLGEGAALLVLEDAEAARERGATILAEVRGGATAFDPRSGGDRAPSAEHAACTRAVRQTLDEAGCGPEEIDVLSASAHGGPDVDRTEDRAVAAALGERVGRLPVTAIKRQLGEGLGASGALQTVVAIEALRRGELPGIPGLDRPEEGLALALAGPEPRSGDFHRALVTAVGLDGVASALVVERPVEVR